MKDLWLWILFAILMILLGLAGKSDYKHHLEIEQAREELEMHLEWRRQNER